MKARFSQLFLLMFMSMLFLQCSGNKNDDVDQLQANKKDFFTGDAWFFGQVEFIRDANGKIEGCYISSGRVRNLLFQKIKS